jgi:putative Mg2+ transporter-C (MgtC) family protein
MNGMDLSYVAKLTVAWILGGLIGLERETLKRPAGLRTHVLVTIGSTLITIVSIEVFTIYQGRTTVDPSRIAAQIVSGIGFLGAGTILREGATIRGLTTAASLWVSAGIGLAVGIGAYGPAVYATAMALFSLVGLRWLETRYLAAKRLNLLSVIGIDRPGLIGELGSALGTLHVNIANVDMNPVGEDGRIRIDFQVQLPGGLALGAVIERLRQVADVTSIEAG